MKLTAAIIQDHYTTQPKVPDETCPAEAIRYQCEAYKETCLMPQLALARQAVEAGAGLLVFREDCNGAGNFALPRMDRPDLLQAMAETIPGPTFESLAGVARAGNCYVVGCFLEKAEPHIFNTSVLIDPRGGLVGRYRKVQLPPVERLMLTPGSDLPVFATDFGLVGMQICYDMMTPEIFRCLALQGADVVCWPSLGYGWWDESGDFTVRSRAHDNQVYLLGALPYQSCIVDPYGDFLAAGGLQESALVMAEIEPGADPLQDPLNHNAYLTQTPSLRERHLLERRPEIYTAITDPNPPLVERYPNTHMHDMEKDRPAAFQRYRAAWGTLHWQTREDKPTH